jgi:hypothetical protein
MAEDKLQSDGSAQAPAEVVLYGTSACHLCEQALSMTQAWIDNGMPVFVRAVDIADRDDLFERYGLVIPVLLRADEQELAWPFSIEELGSFLGG